MGERRLPDLHPARSRHDWDGNDAEDFRFSKHARKQLESGPGGGRVPVRHYAPLCAPGRKDRIEFEQCPVSRVGLGRMLARRDRFQSCVFDCRCRRGPLGAPDYLLHRAGIGSHTSAGEGDCGQPGVGERMGVVPRNLAGCAAAGGAGDDPQQPGSGIVYVRLTLHPLSQRLARRPHLRGCGGAECLPPRGYAGGFSSPTSWGRVFAAHDWIWGGVLYSSQHRVFRTNEPHHFDRNGDAEFGAGGCFGAEYTRGE